MMPSRLLDSECADHDSPVVEMKVARGKYRTFDAWLTGELKKLEARWTSFAIKKETRASRLVVSR